MRGLVVCFIATLLFAACDSEQPFVERCGMQEIDLDGCVSGVVFFDDSLDVIALLGPPAVYYEPNFLGEQFVYRGAYGPGLLITVSREPAPLKGPGVIAFEVLMGYDASTVSGIAPGIDRATGFAILGMPDTVRVYSNGFEDKYKTESGNTVYLQYVEGVLYSIRFSLPGMTRRDRIDWPGLG